MADKRSEQGAPKVTPEMVEALAKKGKPYSVESEEQ